MPKLRQLKYKTLFPNTGVYGFEELMDNLNLKIKEITNSSMKGLIESAALIRRDTERSSPKTPVDLGNLRASWFTVTARGKLPDDSWNTGFRNFKADKRHKSMVRLSGTSAQMATDRANAISEMTAKAKTSASLGANILIMGYSARYAVYVHENIDPGIKWTRALSGPKWFENSVKRNSGRILKIIQDNVIKV